MADYVKILDTTLRDGERGPGYRMNPHEKLEIARQLVRLGVDLIEAGVPASSKTDFDAVQMLCEEIDGPIICALTRTREKEIQRCAEALKDAHKARIHVYISPGDVFMEKNLRLSRERVIQLAADAVRNAHILVPDVEFSPEDTCRLDHGYLVETLDAVIEAGARTINILDTMGCFVPDQIAHLITHLRNHVKAIDQCTISVHCHNDMGLAVANSLAAVQAGARQVECTINGLGERGGNAALEEIVANLMARKDHYRVDLGIHGHEIYRTSRLVTYVTGETLERNKPIVGSDAFTHEDESLHGHMPPTHEYFPDGLINAGDVGWTSEGVVVGKHSRRSAFRARLAEMGFSELSDEDLDRIYDRFKSISERKKEIYDEDLIAIVQEDLARIPEVYNLEYCHVSSGTSIIPSATVRIRRGDDVWLRSSTGDGPIDAVYKAIGKAIGISPKLEQYQTEAVTSGGDALGRVSVRMIIDDTSVRGTSTGMDIAITSAKAFLNALNRYEMLKSAPLKTILHEA